MNVSDNISPTHIKVRGGRVHNMKNIDVDIPCPECGATRYSKDADRIRRIPEKVSDEYTLPELMALSLDKDLKVCQDLPKVKRRLQVLHDLGLGYMTLGEETPGLSDGEAQRLKQASEMGKGQDTTVIVIEHDLDVIRNSDYVIDMGPGGGVQGGRIIATGSPEAIRNNPESVTGRYL